MARHYLRSSSTTPQQCPRDKKGSMTVGQGRQDVAGQFLGEEDGRFSLAREFHRRLEDVPAPTPLQQGAYELPGLLPVNGK